MDEEKEKKPTPDNNGEGVQSETNRTVDDINIAAKRMEEATEKARLENDRTENNYSKMQLGGRAEAGVPAEEPKVLSDTEYAEALQRGEVNPLKEDGIFK